MKYDELDTTAKEHARNAWREMQHCDEWWEHIYSDAVTIGELVGIDIDTQSNRTVGMRLINSPDISFSGFHSQGDGASYSATLRVANFQGAVKKLSTHVGNLDTGNELWPIAKKAEEIFDLITAHAVSNRLAHEDDRQYSECEPTMTIRVTDRFGAFALTVQGHELPPHIEDEVREFAESFAIWIYRQLEAEDEHLHSDEVIEESIRDNDLDFTEDGMFR